jgi:DNA-binding response OmpR family regulator
VVEKILEIIKRPPEEKETLKSFAKLSQGLPITKNHNHIRKILIIEDNEDLNKMFKTAFEAKNFEVEISLNGMDGITKAAAFRPDLILLDIMMPQMDGYEVLQAIKNNTSLETIVVVNTNLDQKKDEEKALQMGASYFYRKSEFTPFEIVDKVEAIFKD